MIDQNFDQIKNKYPKVKYDDALIIASYTYESKERKFNPYKILNSNLVLENRRKGISNVSKYFFILLRSLRKLTRYYPDKTSPFLYRCITNQVPINYDKFKPNLVPYISGKEKTFWSFTSTSLNILTDFLLEDERRNIKCGTVFTLTGEVWGYDISLFNLYDEKEILLEPERKFLVEQVIPPINEVINIRCIIKNTPLVLENFGSKDDIIIRYEINKDDKKIRIFGDKFVENNIGFWPWSNKCKIIYKNNEMNLQSFLELNDYNNNKDGILEIKLKGISYLTDISYMFYKCDRLLAIPDIFMWDTSNVENMEFLFFGCKSLLKIPYIKNWKTSKVKSMKYMFSETNLNSFLNISNWDTSNLQFCEGLLYGFELDISSWNIKKIQDFPLIYLPTCSSEKLKKLYNEYYYIKHAPLKSYHLIDFVFDEIFAIKCHLCKEYFSNICGRENPLNINSEDIISCSNNISYSMNEKIHEHYEEMKIYFKVNNLSPKTFISKFQSIDFDYQFDIGLIGTSCSGKTSILHYFKSGIKLDFPLAHFNMNLGYIKKKIDNYICKITFLDFPGNKKSFDFWIEHLLNLHAIIFVFSLVEDI